MFIFIPSDFEFVYFIYVYFYPIRFWVCLFLFYLIFIQLDFSFAYFILCLFLSNHISSLFILCLTTNSHRLPEWYIAVWNPYVTSFRYASTLIDMSYIHHVKYRKPDMQVHVWYIDIRTCLGCYFCRCQKRYSSVIFYSMCEDFAHLARNEHGCKRDLKTI
jgi:hypothetical protein